MLALSLGRGCPRYEAGEGSVRVGWLSVVRRRQGQAGLEKGGISVELELFLFTSKNVTNIWAGIGAGKWAVSETSPADMQSPITKSRAEAMWQ